MINPSHKYISHQIVAQAWSLVQSASVISILLLSSFATQFQLAETRIATATALDIPEPSIELKARGPSSRARLDDGRSEMARLIDESNSLGKLNWANHYNLKMIQFYHNKNFANLFPSCFNIEIFVPWGLSRCSERDAKRHISRDVILRDLNANG